MGFKNDAISNDWIFMLDICLHARDEKQAVKRGYAGNPNGGSNGLSGELEF
jgi:hypothetical protein